MDWKEDNHRVRHHILLIEDSPDDAEWMSVLLAEGKPYQYDVTHVSSIANAMELFPQITFDAILCDLSLPDAHGIEHVKALLDIYVDIPLLVITANENDENAIFAVNYGAEDFIIKGKTNAYLLGRAVKYAIERNEGKKALKSALQENQDLLEAVYAILIAFDDGYRLTQWNIHAEEVFGISQRQVLGKEILNCGVPWDTLRLLGGLERCQDAKAPVFLKDLNFTKKDGLQGYFDVSLTPRRKNPTAFLMFAKDVTNEKLLEQQLFLEQKLQSIGQLAAGIAHEINTPIQYVGDNLHFLDKEYQELIALLDRYDALLNDADGFLLQNEVVKTGYDIIQKTDISFLKEEIPIAIKQSLEGAQHITKIVAALKEFALPGSSTKVQTDIHRALENALIVLKHEWKYASEITTSFDPQFPLLFCRPSELNQVFLHLIINAVHAIKDRYATCPDSKGAITVATRVRGEDVEIRFSDNGCGISPEKLSKIFDPFFTTKEVGVGSGQGLNIVYDLIVNKHSGFIYVDSQENIGTTFVIRLPIDGKSKVSLEK